MQSVARLPVPEVASDFASQAAATPPPARQFFADDDWYTDADSNAYQLPTFLGNHDMRPDRSVLVSDNPGAGDAECCSETSSRTS